MSKHSLLIAVSILALIGCAAARAKPKQASDTESSDTSDKGSSTTSPSEGKSDMGKPMAAHESDFQSKCVKSPSHKPYCDCAWGVYNSAITLGEMNRGEIPKEKLNQVKIQTAQACSAKMPEDMAKEAFIALCGESFAQFCECLWPPLRKRMPPAEMADKAVLRSDKFSDLARPIAKSCAGKVSEADLKKAFLKSCTEREGAQGDKFCQCTWTEVRKALSPAEIELATISGTIDIYKGQDKIHKACDKLKAE